MLDLQAHLIGNTIKLIPLQADHWSSLMQAASDPLIWQLHPEPLRYLPEVFQSVFAGGLKSGGAFLICDKLTDEVLGTTRYYDFDAKNKSVAIGYTFLVRSRWGGATNTELKQLMLAHAFAAVETVWFHVGENNLRSRRAVHRGRSAQRCFMLSPKQTGSSLYLTKINRQKLSKTTGHGELI